MKIKPNYENMGEWEFYCNDIEHEYKQCVDEGLDIEKYKDVFSSISRLPKGEIKKKLGDVLFEIIISANRREDYPYVGAVGELPEEAVAEKEVCGAKRLLYHARSCARETLSLDYC